MPIFEYKCLCGLLHEHIVLNASEAPDQHECPRCKAQAGKREYPTSIALNRSTMDNPTLDLAVGKSAHERWDNIHKSDEAKAKVRKESGQTGLTLVGPNQFAPISQQQVELRTSLTETIAASGGYRNSEPVPGLP